MMIRKLIIFFVLSFLYSTVNASIISIPQMFQGNVKHEQERILDAELKAKIDKFASEYGKSHPVNFAYLVSKNGIISSEGISIFASKKAYKNPIKQNDQETLLGFDSLIPIASATKQMTAAGILKLQEQGKLNIYDAISRYLPKNSKYWKGNIPKWAKEITLHHLLSQSSGIPDYHGLYIDLQQSEEEIKARILHFMASQKLKHQPGIKFDYSNTNYLILGIIIEEITKQHLSEFFKYEFFKPLGMNHTYLATLEEARDYEAGKLKHKYPKRYFVNPGEEAINFLPVRINRMLPPLGDGGVISTMHDLEIWVHALHEGKVISSDSLKIMRKPYFESNYRKYKMKAWYGYAMHIQELNGETIYSHGCDALGMRGEYSYLKSNKIAVISISNFTLAIPLSLSYNNKEELHNMYKIDLQHFHGGLITKILEKK